MQICIRTKTTFKWGHFFKSYNKQLRVSYRLRVYCKINGFGRNKISDYCHSVIERFGRHKFIYKHQSAKIFGFVRGDI